MADLRATQEWMAALVRHPRSLLGDPALAEAAACHVEGRQRLSPAAQLEIYREQFWLRHTASLLEDFPGLSGILGQAAWEKLVESYLGVVVPTSWTLRDLGYRLPEHVEQATWLPHHELSVDMARLEWTLIELFDAPDAAPLGAARLAEIPEEAWETARLVLSPALALRRVRYPVAELRKALRDRGSEPVPLPEPRSVNLVLYRNAELNLAHAEVSDAAFELLTALGQGVPLGVACERAASRAPARASEVTTKVGEWFSDFGARGWVVDVETR